MEFVKSAPMISLPSMRGGRLVAFSDSAGDVQRNTVCCGRTPRPHGSIIQQVEEKPEPVATHDVADGTVGISRIGEQLYKRGQM
jgi:hypothetical protein